MDKQNYELFGIQVSESLFNFILSTSVILLWVIIIGIVGLFIYAIYKTIKTEKKAKLWRKTSMIRNQKVHVSLTKNSFEAVIKAIDGDYITVQTTINKSKVYPDEV